MRCGLLTGRDRIHSFREGEFEFVVAACSRAGIGYTAVLNDHPIGVVAACSRAGIGYTANHADKSASLLRLAHGPGSDTLGWWGGRRYPVAACSRAGIGYT